MEHSEQLARWIREGAQELELLLGSNQVADLVWYLCQLKKWNQKINLTAITKDRDIIVKLFLDSLYCTRAMETVPDATVLDVGSGAGFPGLPLKIVNHALKLTLLEPHKKKVAFLRYVIGSLGLQDAMAVPERASDFAALGASRGYFSYVLIRALALDSILPFAESLLAKDGKVILCRAKPLGPETKLHGLKLSHEVPYILPLDYGKRVLSVLSRN
ncbi:MAG: 16S rRNA (guanine(527)-N(7))-methyltransferase RsmG [Nitrospirales bacterium]